MGRVARNRPTMVILLTCSPFSRFVYSTSKGKAALSEGEHDTVHRGFRIIEGDNTGLWPRPEGPQASACNIKRGFVLEVPFEVGFFVLRLDNGILINYLVEARVTICNVYNLGAGRAFFFFSVRCGHDFHELHNLELH